MNILEILDSGRDGGAAAALARSFNVDPKAAEAVLESIVPELTQRIERNTLNRGGIADLTVALGHAAERSYLDNPAYLDTPEGRQEGIAYLDQILWSKDRSRAIAHRAAATSGVSEATVKQMLPVVAAMMMGGLAKGAGGSLSDILSKIPGLPGGADPFQLPQSGSNAGTGGATGGGWGGPSPTSEGMGRAPLPMPGGGIGNQSPLPIPGNSRPGGYGGGGTSHSNPLDDLSDVIRRRGQSVPGTGGGSLANIIRGILASVLGFQNRGVMSWILRYVVLRYGASILRWFFSRLFPGAGSAPRRI